MQSVLANLSGKGSEHLKVSLLLQIHNLGGFKNQSVNGTLPFPSNMLHMEFSQKIKNDTFVLLSEVQDQ